MRYPSHPILRRAVLELWFSAYVAMSMRRFPKLRMAIVVIPPSLFVHALMATLSRHIPIVAIVHDLQGIYAQQRRGFLGRLIASVISTIESSALRKCQHVYFLSETMRQRCIGDYGIEGHRSTVSYPPVTIDRVLPNADALASTFPSEFKHVVYSGALGEKQNPEILVQAFATLVALRADVICHVFSAGAVYEALKRSATFHERIRFHPLVESHHVPEMYERSHIQIISQARGTSDASLPSKLPNLLAAGVPIFAICESSSEVAELIRTYSAGHIHSTWDATSIGLALRTYLDKVQALSHRDRRTSNSSQLARDFSIDKLLKSLRDTAVK